MTGARDKPLRHTVVGVNIKVARLDFLGGYLTSFSIDYVTMSKDMGKRLLQLYYIKTKIFL